jgi:hypothetical protein
MGGTTSTKITSETTRASLKRPLKESSGRTYRFYFAHFTFWWGSAYQLAVSLDDDPAPLNGDYL